MNSGFTRIARLGRIGLAAALGLSPVVLGGCDQRASVAAAPRHKAPGVAAAGADLTATDWNGPNVEWLTPEAGLKVAREQNRPILLVVSTGWCGHCRNYKKVFFDPRVVDASHQLVMIHVDSDKDPEFAARYAPDGDYIPRSMVLTPNGTLANNIQLARPSYRHFYDEHDPSSILSAMTDARQLAQ